jgi:PAS domain S-box-containing protein
MENGGGGHGSDHAMGRPDNAGLELMQKKPRDKKSSPATKREEPLSGRARQIESQQALVAGILHVLNRGDDTTALIRKVLLLIRKSTGFDAVGLRIRSGNDYPYYEQSGFPEEFLREANCICERNEDGSAVLDADGKPVLECTCGLVLSGRTDPNMPYFTEGGSFWTNRASELLEFPAAEDPRTNRRNRCIHNGYQSIALIPVRSGQEIIGLLQLNDRREDLLNLETVRFFEVLDDQIGLALKRKQAEEALARERDILQAVMNGAKNSHLVYLDRDFNFVHVNETYARSCGYRPEEMIGKNHFVLYPHAENIAIFKRVRDTGEPVSYHDKPFEFPDQPQRGITYWDWTLIPVKDSDGSVRGLVFSLFETTGRKRSELELKSLNETLERRVAERSAEAERRSEQLRQLASELTSAEHRERQRLAQILHDGLQQILVGAKYRLALLERENNAKQGAAEVADIIDDAIETSRSLTAELSPPILHQGGLLPALEWLVRWMNDKHGLCVDLRANEKIRFPQGQLNVFLFQGIKELLLNVIKHSGVREARIQIVQRGGRIQITVEDDGAGFDQSQLRAAGGRTGGFGLFNLSERLSMLGGSMTIDSSPGRGSRILMAVPLAGFKTDSMDPSTKRRAAVSVAAAATPASGALHSTRKIRIALVDDHIVMRQGLAGLLQSEPDMEIAGQASDGESAVNLIREIRPDVVLMDISMPGMNGIQVTRIIHSELPDICIIGLSMFREGEQARAMREAGAVGYVTKSGPSSAVIAAIRSCAPAMRGTKHL